MTYFGVPIPPFKEQKYTPSSTTIRFVIIGSIPAKKNQQQAVCTRKIARDWANKKAKQGLPPTWKDIQQAISMCNAKMRGNAKYKEFIERQRPIIIKQMQFWSEKLANKGLVFPINKATLSLKLYFKNRHIKDTVNAQQSIQDLLVDCGVIIDDNYKSLNPITSASACYADELIYDIASIVLTFDIK